MSEFPELASQPSMTFSALTFNMQNGQPWDDEQPDDLRIDLEGTVEFLRSQDADIIFLQEVERGFEGGKQINPPPHYQFLQKSLPGYSSVFAYPAPNKDELPFGLGLAIFSKSRLLEFQRIDLPAADISFEYGGKQLTPSQRLLISASTEIHGHQIKLLNTHLQAFFVIGSSSDVYPLQRNIVAAELQAQRGPTLCAGDFNSAPHEGTIAQLTATGFQTVQNKQPTWRREPFVLDHLFFNSHLHITSHAVIPTPCSDHHAVRAQFRFAPPV